MQQNLIDHRYRIVRELGSGGMARVYLAHDEVLDRDVALKVLREHFAEDEAFAERFKREAQSAAALSHANIIQVYDRGEAEGGISYIAMEYVPGGTLKERILGTGSLDPGAAAWFALRIAEALAAAHAKGVVHRDIKPQNIVLTAAGDAKVADFGIARAASAITISQRSMVLGTASYMSPEQAMGQPVTPQSDLYSLGVVLYEMLTGELPYTAESPVAVSMKHLNEPLRPPKGTDPRIPEGINAVVVKLLAKDPANRYENADELAEDLRRVRDGYHPLANGLALDDSETTRVTAQTTMPVGSMATPKRGRARMPWIVAAALALVVLLGGLGLASTRGIWQQDSAPGEADRPAGVEVPNVEGLTQARARQELIVSGFGVDVRPRESSAATANKVLEQSPAASETAKKGSQVVIEVGNGPPNPEVPDVVGLGLSEAKAALDEEGLTIGLQRKVPSTSAPEDVVIEQGYTAGEKVEPGTAVNLGISSGPKQIVAPAAASVSASAPASASALGNDADEGGVIDDNSGPGSRNGGPDNSGPGSSD